MIVPGLVVVAFKTGSSLTVDPKSVGDPVFIQNSV